MGKKIRFQIVVVAGMAMLISFMCWVARADMQIIPVKIITVGSTNNTCPGLYYAYSRMTNSSGSIWLQPPTNTTTGTFTDASGFGPPYSSLCLVLRQNDGTSWCGSNSVTFPATNSTAYQLVLVIKNRPPPPTNSQPLSLQIVWR
jgi:hypothetical protein